MKKISRMMIGITLLMTCFFVVGCHKPSQDYMVTFQTAENDPAPVVQRVKENEKATSFIPTIKGYTFKGWYADATYQNDPYDFDTPVKKDFVLYAKWEKDIVEVEKVVLSFALAGGQSSSIQNMTVAKGTEVTLPNSDDLIRDGYLFDGWKDIENDGTVYAEATQYVVQKDITLTAQWVRGITICFEYDNGDASSEMVVKFGSTITLPTSEGIVKDDYRFAGWICEDTFYQGGFEYLVNSGQSTFKAVWAGAYTVSFDADGGTGTLPGDTVYQTGDTVTLPDALSKVNHTFMGWTDGVNTYQAGATYEVKYCNVALTAVWRLNAYRVRFVDWDGFVVSDQQILAGAAASAPDLPIFQVEEFVRWDQTFDQVTSDLVVRPVYTYTTAPVKAFIFTLNPDMNSYSVTASSKLASVIPADLYIPHSYKGKPVTGLSDYTGMPAASAEIGFFQCHFIETVHFPSTIEYIGTSAFFNCDGLSTVVFAETSNLKEIAASAFYSCDKIIALHLPKTLEQVGSGSFHNCTSLETLSFGGKEEGNLTSIGQSAFQACIQLSSVELPNSLELIGSSAFQDCLILPEIVIPEGVITISQGAFFNCTGLSNLVFEGNHIITIGVNAFQSNQITMVTIPSSVETIGRYAFYGNKTLTEVLFVPTSHLKTIGEAAFGNCLALKRFNATVDGTYCFPASVETIDKLAFVYTPLLEVVTFEANANIKTIGDMAFAGNHPLYAETENKTNRLRSFTIPKTVTSFGDKVFLACDYLAEIFIEEGNAVFKSENGCMLTIDGKTLLAYPIAATASSLQIPEGVEVIPEKLFYLNNNLQAIKVPNTVTTIGEKAFSNMKNIEQITLSANLTTVSPYLFAESKTLQLVIFAADSKIVTIEEGAFFRCVGLQSIEIPASVQVIGTSAFDSCSGLASVTFAPNSQLNEIGLRAFYSDFGFAEYINTVLTTITIPRTVQVIGAGAFYYAKGLTTVVFEEGSLLTTIDVLAFSGSGLTTFTLPQSITTLGAWAFSECNNLLSFTFAGNSKLKKLENGVFSAAGITTITLPQSITAIGDSAFSGSAMETFVMSDNVTEIGIYLFMNCFLLQSVVFSNNLLLLPIHTLSDCHSLTDVTLPNRLAVLGNYSFYKCRSIANVTLPASVNFVGMSAFSGATNLQSVTVLANFPPMLGGNSARPEEAISESMIDSVFSGTALTNIFVKQVYVGSYKQKWLKYAAYVKAVVE